MAQRPRHRAVLLLQRRRVSNESRAIEKQFGERMSRHIWTSNLSLILPHIALDEDRTISSAASTPPLA